MTLEIRKIKRSPQDSAVANTLRLNKYISFVLVKPVPNEFPHCGGNCLLERTSETGEWGSNMQNWISLSVWTLSPEVEVRWQVRSDLLIGK